MSPAELHADSIVIDGLIIAKWNRELFEDMRKGGLTAANCTVSVWEGFQATVNNIASSQKLIRENSDLVMPVRTTADIRKAKELGKTGILFGFQNAHAFEDQIGYVELLEHLDQVGQVEGPLRGLCCVPWTDSTDTGSSCRWPRWAASSRPPMP